MYFEHDLRNNMYSLIMNSNVYCYEALAGDTKAFVPNKDLALQCVSVC